MTRLNRPSSILVLIAYAAVSVLAAAGPRVLCLANDDPDVAVIERPAAACCDRAGCAPGDGAAGATVPRVNKPRSAACEFCVDLTLPGSFDQVAQRATALDRAFHAALAVPAGAGWDLAAAVETPHCGAGHDPPLADSPGFSGRAPILRC